jgi:hypothetical protein
MLQLIPTVLPERQGGIVEVEPQNAGSAFHRNEIQYLQYRTDAGPLAEYEPGAISGNLPAIPEAEWFPHFFPPATAGTP